MAGATTQSFETLLGSDLWVLASRQPGELLNATPLTSLPSNKLERATFLLEYADGRRLKGRRADSDYQAEKIERVLSALEHSSMPAFLDRHGAALLMQWIPGRPLQSETEQPKFLERIGALQGGIHAQTIPERLYATYVPTPEDWPELLDRQIGQLAEHGALSPVEAAETRKLARDTMPAFDTFTFCHGDLHPENIVFGDNDDRLYIIDNENVGIHAPYYDIVRTWHRWPLHGDLWKAYLSGYRSAHRLENFSQQFAFWAVFVLVQSALFRIEGEIHGADETIRKLKDLLDNPATGLE